MDDLLQIGKTEEQHVVQLQSAIAQAGVQPVRPCAYRFGFADAASMVATAAVLENVGVSAYLGAAALLADPSVLAAAASILTVEARHQTFVRAASRAVAVPQAFDAPLSVRQVFSLAAPFIESCPEGSSLVALEAFPTLSMADDDDDDDNAGGGIAGVAPGATIRLRSEAPAAGAAAGGGATHCAFTSGGVVPGGTAFSAFDAEAGTCVVPQGLAGITYVSLASAGPLDGVLTDEMVVAGPMVVQVS